MRLFVLAAALLAAVTAQAQPAAWALDPAKSTLGFVSNYMTTEVKGVFKTFTADLRFDPADLAASRVTVDVDVTSVDTAYADRDSTLKTETWFNAGSFPKAVYTASAFEATGLNAYRAKGELSLAGVTRPLDLLFTLAITPEGTAKVARVQGETTLNRLEFGIGKGEWADTKLIADPVKVSFDLTARQ